MLKKILLLPLFFISINLYAQGIIGKWHSSMDGEVGYFIFDSLGYATMEIGGELMGGKYCVIEGKACFMKYKLNETSKPFKLDMILYNFKRKKEIRRIIGIYEFLPNNKLKICLNTEGGARPSNFKSKEDCLVFTKTNP